MAEIEKEVRENTVPEVDTGQEDFEEEDVVVDDNGEIPDEMLSRYGLFLRRLKEKFHHRQEGHRERHKLVSYAKYGYLFLIPFFISFAIFQLAPLIGTFVYSFTKYYYKLGRPVGPTFIGFENYVTVFTPTTTNDIVSAPQFFRYFGNTMIMWLMGFVPQIIISLCQAPSITIRSPTSNMGFIQKFSS